MLADTAAPPPGLLLPGGSTAGGGGGAPQAVTVDTFRQLLDELTRQRADVDSLLPSCDADLVRLNAAGLKRSLLPWPAQRLAELHQLLPSLAAGVWFCAGASHTLVCARALTACRPDGAHLLLLLLLLLSLLFLLLVVGAPADVLHDFVSGVQAAQSRLTALCTSVDDYVDKMAFLGQLLASEAAMDYTCSQVRACVCVCVSWAGWLRTGATWASCTQHAQPTPQPDSAASRPHDRTPPAARRLPCKRQQVHALFALLDEYKVRVPDEHRAGFATMDSSYGALKALAEDAEGGKDAAVAKYSAELAAGARSW